MNATLSESLGKLNAMTESSRKLNATLIVSTGQLNATLTDGKGKRNVAMW